MRPQNHAGVCYRSSRHRRFLDCLGNFTEALRQQLERTWSEHGADGEQAKLSGQRTCIRREQAGADPSIDSEGTVTPRPSRW
jgi:hypothetical protein